MQVYQEVRFSMLLFGMSVNCWLSAVTLLSLWSVKTSSNIRGQTPSSCVYYRIIQPTRMIVEDVVIPYHVTLSHKTNLFPAISSEQIDQFYGKDKFFTVIFTKVVPCRPYIISTYSVPFYPSAPWAGRINMLWAECGIIISNEVNINLYVAFMNLQTSSLSSCLVNVITPQELFVSCWNIVGCSPHHNLRYVWH